LLKDRLLKLELVVELKRINLEEEESDSALIIAGLEESELDIFSLK
jgi:hypothetical protein